MAEEQSQEDIVRNKLLKYDEVPPESFTETLKIPGIKELHLQDRDSIAEALKRTFLNVLKSRPGITSFTYEIGKEIKVTYRPAR
jgi:hypothetical protein